MSRCALCGEPTPNSRGLCTFHSHGQDDGWAAGNRIMCDFLHRHIVSPGAPDLAGGSIELPVDMLETALTE